MASKGPFTLELNYSPSFSAELDALLIHGPGPGCSLHLEYSSSRHPHITPLPPSSLCSNADFTNHTFWPPSVGLIFLPKHTQSQPLPHFIFVLIATIPCTIYFMFLSFFSFTFCTLSGNASCVVAGIFICVVTDVSLGLEMMPGTNYMLSN